MSSTTSAVDRATAALYGLAIGDALGMPTQMMSRESITARWGRLSGFEPADDANVGLSDLDQEFGELIYADDLLREVVALGQFGG